MVSIDEACGIALRESKVEYGGFFVSGVAASEGHCFVSVSMRNAESPLMTVCVSWLDGSCASVRLPSEEGYALLGEFLAAAPVAVPEQFR